MEALLILLLIWIIIGPVLAIIALVRINDLNKELRLLRAVDQRPLNAPQPDVGASGRSEPPAPEPARAAGPPPRSETARESRKTRPLQTETPTRRQLRDDRPTRSWRDWERLIASNWMIWIGGLTIALGGLLLVRFVIEAGLLNDAMRTGLGAMFGAALIGAGYRAESWILVREGEGAVSKLPSIFVAAGVTTLNGAVYAAGALYGLVSPILALAGFVGVAAIAVALSLRFGRWVAALGFIGGYAGPLLTGGEDGSVTLLMAYAAGITIGALALIRLRDWWQLIPITLIGAGFWGLAGLTGSTPDFAEPTYAIVIALAGLFFGEAPARSALAIPELGPDRVRNLFSANSIALLSAYSFAALGGGLIIFALVAQPDQTPIYALMAFAGVTLFAGQARTGYGLVPVIGGATTIISLLIWPHGEQSLTMAVIATAFGFGGLGATLSLRHPDRTGLAIAGALVPPAALFIPISGPFDSVLGFWWGFAALAVAVSMTAIIDLVRRRSPGFEGIETQAAIFAIGASLATVLAPFAFLEGLWLGSALGVVALVIALVHRRFDLAVLRYGSSIAIAGSVALLIRPWLIDQSAISSTPIFNELLFGFGVAILAIGAIAWIIPKDKSLRQSAFGGALVLGFTLIGLEIRHFAQGGDIYQPGVTLGELSGYAIAYIGMAASLAWRLSKDSLLFRSVERIGFIIGAGAVVIGLFVVQDTQIGMIPVFNLLMPAFALPALLLAGYASALRRSGRSANAYLEAWLAMGLGFTWITLETRRAVTNGDLTMLNNGEGVWAYSISWLIYALILLLWGTWRQRFTARLASLLVLLTTLVKVFILDLSALEGATRAGSFIGFGLVLIGIALFYQRFVFGGGKPRAA